MPRGEYVPSSQGAQPTVMPIKTSASPAEQTEQAADPRAAYLPDSHASQLTEPGRALYVSTGQSAQLVARCSLA